jgi:phosphoenolpyruvate carboxykinase (GTP)
MLQNVEGFLKERLGEEGYNKLMKIDNVKLHEFLARYIDLCNPEIVNVYTDSEEDIRKTREAAVRNHEEAQLAEPNHTLHFDGYFDQARDKPKTKFLLPEGRDLGPEINATHRDEGLKEIHEIMKDIMSGKELHVKFFCLGPTDSQFSTPCVQMTDSAYVAHSEDLLYRQGYSEFIRQGKDAKFFKFVHSAGELETVGLGLGVSRNIDKRRVYIDLEDEVIYSANTQYGGNTIGLKKLAMRLAINRASKEGWLTEHMLVMGVNGPKGRTSYFTGAFPSMCGKTSTAMIEGETIVGDDIAYIRKMDGEARAVNVESGIFGIIEGINDVDDVLQWKALSSSEEIIFSNPLYHDSGKVYWNGKPGDIPEKGVNHSGDWHKGKTDEKGNTITPSHKNARFTIRLSMLGNVDPSLHEPSGVPVAGFIYGGRDSDTWVPVEEAFDWAHGIITKGAGLESETTAATLGQEGVRVFNPMSNLDFLSIPIGRYIQDNLDFGESLAKHPNVFSVNYFLRDKDGGWLNHKNDKRIWLKWMELRVNGDIKAIKTPTGYIPVYEDLKRLFREVYDKDYTEEDYVKQFTVRIPENIAKIDRIIEIYKTRVIDTPQIVFNVLEEQRKMLLEAQKKYGDYIAPNDL